MFRFLALVTAATISTTSLADAQNTWLTETGQGVRDSIVSTSQGSLNVTCSVTASFMTHQVGLTDANGPVTGEATLVITGGPRFALDFDNGEFIADTPENADLFHDLHAALKQARLLVAVLPDGKRAVFPTTGLAAALGDCPERGITVAARPKTLADILAERRAAAPVDDVVYHQIANCIHERGLATVTYLLKDDTIRIEMTDLCFDRANSRLMASEPIQSMKPTYLIEGVQMYEARSPGLQAAKALEAIIGVYFWPLNDRNAKEADSVLLSVESNGGFQAIQHDTAHFSIAGYLFRHTSPPSRIAAPFRVTAYGQPGKALGQRPYWSPRQGFTAGLNFEGQLDLVAGGVLTGARNVNYPGTSTIPKITLSADAAGVITGSGTFAFTNQNPDHARPIDWATSEWRIVKLIGHLTGRSGSTFGALGVMRSTTTDHDGHVHEALTPIAIYGTDMRIVPEVSEW